MVFVTDFLVMSCFLTSKLCPILKGLFGRRIKYIILMRLRMAHSVDQLRENVKPTFKPNKLCPTGMQIWHKFRIISPAASTEMESRR